MEQDWIPVHVRAWLYRALTVTLGLNAIFGVFSSGVADKIVAVAALFGFGMASNYTSTKGY